MKRTLLILCLLSCIVSFSQIKVPRRFVPATGGGGGEPPAASVPSRATRFLVDHARTDVDMTQSPYNVTTSNSTGLNTLQDNYDNPSTTSINIIALNNNITYAGTPSFPSPNNWLDRLYDVRITGGASTSFQSTYNGIGADGAQRPFWVRSPTYPRFGYSAGNGGGSGFLFNTVAAGSTTITLTNSGEISNFFVGQRIRLSGRELKYIGMPPTPQFDRHHTIMGISGATITLDRPLENSWNSNWWEDSNYAAEDLAFGKPRAFRLDISSPVVYTFPRHIYLKDMILKPAISPANGALNISADTLVTDGVVLQSGMSNHPSDSRITLNANGSAPDMEVDKRVDSSFVDNYTFSGNITAGIGANWADFRFVTASRILINPRAAYFESVTLNSGGQIPWYHYPEGIGTDKMIWKNCTATDAVNEGSVIMAFPSYSNFTLDGTNIFASSGDISFPSSSQLWYDTVKHLTNGSYIWTSAGKVLRVDDLWFTSNRFIAKVSGGTPVNGEKYHWNLLTQGVDLGGNVNTTFGIPFFSASEARWNNDTAHTLISTHLTIFDKNDFMWSSQNGSLNCPWIGTIDSIEVNVKTAYSGAAANAFIRVSKNTTELFKVNLKVTGKRMYGVSSTTGFAGSGNDLSVNAASGQLGSFVEFLKIETTDGAGIIDGISSGNYGDVEMRIKWKPYQSTQP